MERKGECYPKVISGVPKTKTMGGGNPPKNGGNYYWTIFTNIFVQAIAKESCIVKAPQVTVVGKPVSLVNFEVKM